MIIDPKQGVTVIQPTIHRDVRGNLVEVHQAERLAEMGINVTFVQDNYSRSVRNTIRGLDYQLKHTQAKLVFVTRGTILDVAVDLRRRSARFGKWSSVLLNDEEMRQIYVPPGFAHGYCVLSDFADVIFKCSDYYHPEYQRCIAWNDPQLGIEWPIETPILSGRQHAAISFSEAPYFE
jgi:dTDP-4-dehydrorhamnose 3,5-epimerase